MRPDDSLIGDMLVYARRALRHVQGIDYAAFTRDELRQDAAIRALPVVGEAAWKVSDDCREANQAIDWFRIAGLRHRLVHHYSEIRLDILWSVLATDVPELVRMLEPLVSRALQSNPDSIDGGSPP